MYGVRVCVAAKVRMIPLPILYCHRGSIVQRIKYLTQIKVIYTCNY